jgi:hypothetical protein
MPTLTDTSVVARIMRLHAECMHKLATPANEHAFRAAVEELVAQQVSSRKHDTQAAMQDAPAKFCPFCAGTLDLHELDDWTIRCNDPNDKDNVATVSEHQCGRCSRSFWV